MTTTKKVTNAINKQMTVLIKLQTNASNDITSKDQCTCHCYKISLITNFEVLNGNFKDACDTETNLACSYSPHPKAV